MNTQARMHLRHVSFFLLKIVIGLAFLIGFPASRLLSAQEAAEPKPEPKPVLSDKALSADQLAVYRVVLAAWMDNNKGTHVVHLAVRTLPFQLSDMDADCGKAFHMTEGSVNEVHTFRPEELAQLAPSKVELVDPEAQSKEVAANDPHANIRSGNRIEDAVENAFAHGLTTLGEIHFDKAHTHAIVSYDFSCGRTCGNGSTVILEKKNGRWGIQGHCSTSVA